MSKNSDNKRYDEADLKALLKKVERPGRYIGGEVGQVLKPDGSYSLHMAFAFPDLYEIGMSYLGLQILYDVVNRRDDIYMERVFEPAPDMRSLLKDQDIPLFSLETKTFIKDFDVLGFTLQYEMSYTDLIDMLELSGIPLLSKDRAGDMPLVIAGGPCAFNPEPLADMIDCFLIGDGEELLPEFLGSYEKAREEGIGREEFLKTASGMRGVYVPSMYEPVYEDGKVLEIRPEDGAAYPVKKALIDDIEHAPFPVTQIIPNIEAVHDRSCVEIFRGCTRGCRFCQAGMIYRPVRERSKDNILDMAGKQLENTGNDELSLLSLSTSDHSEFEELATKLMDVCSDMDVSLSLPSLRFDTFSFKVLNEIQKYKKSGLTFAVEAGTDRLRRSINKGITEEEVLDACGKAMDLGWRHVKLYFMIGLPGETYEDLDGIPELARKIMSIAASKGVKGRFNITVSVSNFVPKPFTPFQYAAQDTTEELIKKKEYLFEKLKIKGVRFTCHDAYVSKIEAILAKGDRRVSELLINAHREGCMLDGWSEHFDAEKWDRAIGRTGFDPYLISDSPMETEGKLPWDVIDPLVDKEYLLSELEKSEEALETRDCRKGCNACGISKYCGCAERTGK